MTQSEQDKNHVCQNYKVYVATAEHYIQQALHVDNVEKANVFQEKAIDTYEKLLSCIDTTHYLLTDASPVVPKEVLIQCLFNCGTLQKTRAQHLMNRDKSGATIVFNKALSHFIKILRVTFEHTDATKQIVSIHTMLCQIESNNTQQCLQHMCNALFFSPDDEIVHYNLGFLYNKCNKLDTALIHCKMSIAFCKARYTMPYPENVHKLILNNYNTIASIFRSMKQWPESLYYLLQAHEIDQRDPDIHNQLGVVYTEMRRTDLADSAYKTALANVQTCFISTNPITLQAELYLNHGHMHSYNGDNTRAIDCYNKALTLQPHFHLPFQNKLMNLNYLFDQLDDKSYIFHQHKLINKLLDKTKKFTFDKSFFDTSKINVGIISGDFTDHPVSYFISTFLSGFDNTKFSVTCYSECMLDTAIFNRDIAFKIIKNMSAPQAADVIHNDKIHILFDLAGHTAHNRLDIFALQPSPVQVTYIGYPYSTGLDEMQYRITDGIADDMHISQAYYTEQLIPMKHCFLCYDPTVYKRNEKGTLAAFVMPRLGKQPFLENGYVTIGCFNRLNKMTDSVIAMFNGILKAFPSVRFVFKTKALINTCICKQFMSKFDEQVQSRISVLDCTLLHEEHLLEYNKIDIAIDTFPYSGTTTSCEALLMGVPVFTLYDTKYYFHAQNVTASILKNSNLDWYVVDSIPQLHSKIASLVESPQEEWCRRKESIRNLFLNGNVCNKELYLQQFTEVLETLYKKHSV